MNETPMSAPARKTVYGAPRIFLSYRRDDSIAITGRIYDRLVAAFGERYVFKDVDDIPAGANFKATLEHEVTGCDVLLAIIGDRWLNIEDASGHRRLDDPQDFVRIEIESALNHPDRLVIPVLVNNAAMPGLDALPPTLADLTYRNAAVVRNDPDFNRDMSWLIEQIQHSFDIQPVPGAAPVRRARFRWWMLPVALLALLLVVSGLFLASITPPPPAPTATPDGTFAATPLPSDQFLVLVAQPEHVGGPERDVQRFIVQNLQDTFQDAVASPNLIVAPYPDIITNEQAARQAAEARGATVIVWGNYNADRIELTVAAGAIEKIPYLTMPREFIDPISSLRVRLTDEHSQSIASHVVAIQALLQLAAGNQFEAVRMGVIFREMKVPAAEIIERNTASANWFRSVPDVFSETGDTLEGINGGIERAPGNPILLGWRASAYFRLGRFDDTLRDLGDADSALSQPWAWSVMLRGAVNLLRNSPDQAVEAYTTAIQLQPDNWYPYYFRGTIYYATQQYDKARADMEKAISYNPPVNFPYAFAAMLAVRDARLIEAQNLFKTIKLRFPDPQLGFDFISAAANSETQKRFPVNLGALIGAFGHITLRQYDKVINDMDAVIASNPNLAEAYGIQGIAYCNYQKQYAAAEAAYTKGISIDPNLSLLYALRAEVRLKQNNALGGVADGAAAAQSPQGAIYLQLMPLIQKGELGCENLFDYDLSKIATAPPAALPTVTPAASLAVTADATAP
jgi:tetratricopeptide (TPR) repeat protein